MDPNTTNVGYRLFGHFGKGKQILGLRKIAFDGLFCRREPGELSQVRTNHQTGSTPGDCSKRVCIYKQTNNGRERQRRKITIKAAVYSEL